MARDKKPQVITKLEHETRKLKAIITFIIYIIVLLFLKVFFDTVMSFPEISYSGIFIFITLTLAVSVLLINRFSKNVILKIKNYVYAIQEGRKYAETLFATTPDPLLILNADHKINAANRAFYSLFKISETDASGQSIFDIQKDLWDTPKIRLLLKDINDPRINFDNIEIERQIEGGIHQIMLVSSRLVLREGKKVILISIKDITQQKAIEETLKKQKVQLQIASRAKSDFLANMSHELRTPLNSIIGFSEILRDGLSGEKLAFKQRDYVTEIFKNGHYLLTLINDILDLSKIEAGKMTLNLEEVYLPMLIQNTLVIIKESAANHMIQLNLEIREEIGNVYVDSVKIKQILFNLLSNAIKFTKQGGKVMVKAQFIKSPDTQSAPTADENLTETAESQPPDLLEISVSDTGIGISQQNLQKLFKPFEQLDNSLSRKYKGTGLGLAMVKRLTELHGGQVSVKSELGVGSTFTIRIPYQPRETPAE